MAVLTVASKANAALILPAILAAAYTVHADPGLEVTVNYRDVESLGTQNEWLELATEDGGIVVDDAVLLYFYHNIEIPSHENIGEVGLLSYDNDIQAPLSGSHSIPGT
jgi:hypothetical protein